MTLPEEYQTQVFSELQIASKMLNAPPKIGHSLHPLGMRFGASALRINSYVELERREYHQDTVNRRKPAFDRSKELQPASTVVLDQAIEDHSLIRPSQVP